MVSIERAEWKACRFSGWREGNEGTPQLSSSKFSFWNFIWRELLGKCIHTNPWPGCHSTTLQSLSLGGTDSQQIADLPAILSIACCSIANSNPCIVKNTFGRRIFEPMQTLPTEQCIAGHVATCSTSTTRTKACPTDHRVGERIKICRQRPASRVTIIVVLLAVVFNCSIAHSD